MKSLLAVMIKNEGVTLKHNSMSPFYEGAKVMKFDLSLEMQLSIRKGKGVC